MANLSMDQAFVQAPEHRPKAFIAEAAGIPVIDLSPLAAGDQAGVEALAAEVGRASREWGFFVVVRHGVPDDTMARALEAQRAFFAMPAERKAAVRRDAVAPLGYYESEHTKNVRDWKEVFDFFPREPPLAAAVADGELVFVNKWPQDLPGFREALEEYAKAMEELALKLLELISQSLGLKPDRLHGFFKGDQTQTTFVRLNHYPPCPSPDLALGVTRHKDAGALTVLHQDDVGGLDVRRRSDGEWVRVSPVPGSLVVNVGDIVQVWSNDRYQSAEHRASVNSRKERFSLPYFFNPGSGAMIEPLEELVSDDSPPRYRAYNWGVFFRTKRSSNFKKLAVENLQIAHFKKDLDQAHLVE
ncbi:jasmonate-induced oxygenase 2-like [Lolium rigidum]|uniref:jasmonate-induced oxygenase 2-like n=1 Tax=Lolium rigidum TaxID=89674 RepID=UPI001F5D08BF|nr:jasmonate-induced oxygenase 2-like [Lolium rigidum]